MNRTRVWIRRRKGAQLSSSHLGLAFAVVSTGAKSIVGCLVALCGASALASCGNPRGEAQLPIVAQKVADRSVARPLIVSATLPEFEAVAAHIEGGPARQAGPSRVLEGSISGVPVILLLSGVSTVHAAMTTQWALDTYDVDAIVVSGVAAGLSRELNVGDVAVVRRWAKYDEMKYFQSAKGRRDLWRPGRWRYGVAVVRLHAPARDSRHRQSVAPPVVRGPMPGWSSVRRPRCRGCSFPGAWASCASIRLLACVGWNSACPVPSSWITGRLRTT